MTTSGLKILVLIYFVVVFGTDCSPIGHKTPCNVDSVPVQSDLDLRKMSGMWYNLGGTHNVYGDNSWTSSVWNFVTGEDNTTLLAFRGYSPMDSKCTDIMIGSIEENILNTGHTKFLLKIVYTDYDLAVTYLCTDYDTTDACARDKMDVNLWSRDPRVSTDRIEDLFPYVHQACEESAHIVYTETGKCQDPYISASIATKDLVGGNTHQVTNVLALPGNTATLPCSIFGSNMVIWKRDNAMLTLSDRRITNDFRISIERPAVEMWNLVIRDISANYQGVYQCFYNNDHVRKVVLTIAKEPQVLELYKTGDVEVAEGEDAVFYCNASGIPEPSISWYFKRDSEFDDAEEIALNVTGTTLLLESVVRSQTGRYRCMAVNGFEPSSSTDMSLTVDYAPVIKLPSTHIEQPLGTDVSIECMINAEPFPEVMWLHQGEVVHPDGVRRYISVFQEEGDTIVLSLNIESLESSDLGIYTCSASNDLGERKMHMLLHESLEGVNTCDVGNIPIQKNFNLNRFAGLWHRIKVTTTRYGENTYPSDIMAIVVEENTPPYGGFRALYSAYSPSTGKCKEVQGPFIFEMVKSGDYVFSEGVSKSAFKVVYTDYDYAVIYMNCLETGTEEDCPPSSKHVEILSRQETVPEDKMQLLELLVSDICVTPEDMLTAIPGLCPFSSEQLSQYSLDIPNDENRCKLVNIKSQENFDARKFSGDLYTIATTTSPSDVHGALQPAQYVTDPDGRLYLLITPYSSANDACLTTEVVLKSWNEEKQWFQHEHHDSTVITKFLYSDYTNTVMYTCSGLDENGVCESDKSKIVIYSRNKTIDGTLLLKLKRFAVDACVPVNNIEILSENSRTCKASEEIVADTRAGKITEADIRNKIGCKLKYIPVPPGLTVDMISGAHYTVYSNGMPPDNQHGPTYLVATENGGLVMLLTQYNMRQKACNPTGAMVFSRESVPGNFSYDIPNGPHVISMIVHTDEENHNAVIYKCLRVDADGYCNPMFQSAKILSKDKVITTEKFLELKRASLNKCIDVERLQPVRQGPVVCSVPQSMLDKAKSGTLHPGFSVIGCMTDFIPVHPNLDPTKMIGSWNTILTTNNIKRLTKSTSEVGNLVISNNMEAFYIHRSYRQSWRSCEPAEVIRLIPTGTPGDYTIHREKEYGFVKVVYTDYTNAVTYTCYSVRADGTCDPKSLHVRIVSRKKSLSIETLEKLRQKITPTCAKFDDMIVSTPGQCPIPKTVITAVQEGEITEDFSRPLVGCNDHIVPVHENLNTSMLLGSWNHIYRPSKFMHRKTAKSKISHLLPVKGGLLRLWRGYNDTTELCRPTEAGRKIEASAPGDYFYEAPHFPIIFKIIYTDYVNAVTLSCLGVDQEGKCMKNRLLVEIISRNTDIDADKLQPLFDYITQACGDVNGLGKKSAGLCSIPPSLIDSAKAGDVTEDYTVVQCKTHLIPVQENFDLDLFVGKWNVLKKSVFISGESSSTSHQRWLLKTNSGKLLMAEKEFFPSPVDSCAPTNVYTLEPGSRPGHYIIHYKHNISVMFKVIFTDYSQAVTYFCLGTGSDGGCLREKLQIEIWSKETTISSDTFFELRHWVADSCVDVGDLLDVTPGLCEVPTDILDAARADEINTERPDTECAVRFLPVQENFDFHNFTGIWHAIYTTKYLFKNNTWTSSVWNYIAKEDGTYYIAYRGFAPYLNKCTRTSSLQLHDEGQEGYMSTRSTAGQKVHIKVLATDYDTVLMYTCVYVDADGFCAPHKNNLEIGARDPNIDPAAVLEKYRRTLYQVCTETSELTMKETGVCDNPYMDGTKCLLSDIQVAESFSFLQLAGLWYEIARTRFTFNKMESSMYYYNYNTTDQYFHGSYSGTYDGVCQPPMSSLTKRHQGGPEAYMLGKLGDENSIYPWVSFYIVYFDGYNVVFYACYNKQDDGSCRGDQMEVAVLGRVNEIGVKLQTALPNIMTNLCLNISDLVTTNHDVDCTNPITGSPTANPVSKTETRALPDVSSCLLKDIQTSQNIDITEVLGFWYGIATVDFGARDTHSTEGFVMRLAQVTALSYRIQLQKEKNGRCQVVNDVIVKRECENSNNGDFLSTSGSTMMTQWTRLKILHHNENELVLYWCTKETDEGQCELTGVRVALLSRQANYQRSNFINLDDRLSSICLQNDNLVDVESSAMSACHPETLPPPPSPPPIMPLSSCAVDVLPNVDVDLQKIAGFWYEVGGPPPDPLFPLSDLVIHYQLVGNGNIKMVFSGVGNDGQCQGPLTGVYKTRCLDNPDGRFLGRLDMPNIWTWSSMQILYTDYDHLTVTYTCINEREDGSCNPASAKAHILSRSPSIDEDERQRMNAIIRSACLSQTKKNTQHGKCRALVEGFESIQLTE